MLCLFILVLSFWLLIGEAYVWSFLWWGGDMCGIILKKICIYAGELIKIFENILQHVYRFVERIYKFFWIFLFTFNISIQYGSFFLTISKYITCFVIIKKGRLLAYIDIYHFNFDDNKSWINREYWKYILFFKNKKMNDDFPKFLNHFLNILKESSNMRIRFHNLSKSEFL